VELVEPDILDRSGLSIGKNNGFADQSGLGFLEGAKNGRSLQFCRRHLSRYSGRPSQGIRTERCPSRDVIERMAIKIWQSSTFRFNLPSECVNLRTNAEGFTGARMQH
jgi:hypothetical protein